MKRYPLLISIFLTLILNSPVWAGCNPILRLLGKCPDQSVQEQGPCGYVTGDWHGFLYHTETDKNLPVDLNIEPDCNAVWSWADSSGYIDFTPKSITPDGTVIYGECQLGPWPCQVTDTEMLIDLGGPGVLRLIRMKGRADND